MVTPIRRRYQKEEHTHYAEQHHPRLVSPGSVISSISKPQYPNSGQSVRQLDVTIVTNNGPLSNSQVSSRRVGPLSALPLAGPWGGKRDYVSLFGLFGSILMSER